MSERLDTLELAEQIYRADFAPTHVKPWRFLDSVTREQYRKRAQRVADLVEDQRAAMIEEGEQACAYSGHDGLEEDLEDARRETDRANTYIEALEQLLDSNEIPFPHDPR